MRRIEPTLTRARPLVCQRRASLDRNSVRPPAVYFGVPAFADAAAAPFPVRRSTPRLRRKSPPSWMQLCAATAMVPAQGAAPAWTARVAAWTAASSVGAACPRRPRSAPRAVCTLWPQRGSFATHASWGDSSHPPARRGASTARRCSAGLRRCCCAQIIIIQSLKRPRNYNTESATVFRQAASRWQAAWHGCVRPLLLRWLLLPRRGARGRAGTCTLPPPADRATYRCSGGGRCGCTASQLPRARCALRTPPGRSRTQAAPPPRRRHRRAIRRRTRTRAASAPRARNESAA